MTQDVFKLLSKLIWVPGMIPVVIALYYPRIHATGWVTGITDTIIVLIVLALIGDIAGTIIGNTIGYLARFMVEL